MTHNEDFEKVVNKGKDRYIPIFKKTIYIDWDIKLVKIFKKLFRRNK